MECKLLDSIWNSQLYNYSIDNLKIKFIYSFMEN